MKSKQTREELTVAAMLLGEGWWYDYRDHTFTLFRQSAMIHAILDADTMKPIRNIDAYLEGDHSENMRRRKLVREGEIGAADGPFTGAGEMIT